MFLSYLRYFRTSRHVPDAHFYSGFHMQSTLHHSIQYGMAIAIMGANIGSPAGAASLDLPTCALCGYPQSTKYHK